LLLLLVLLVSLKYAALMEITIELKEEHPQRQ